MTGYFAIDLLATGLVPTAEQTSFIYAYSGEHMTGPVPCAVVSEASLRR